MNLKKENLKFFFEGKKHKNEFITLKIIHEE